MWAMEEAVGESDNGQGAPEEVVSEESKVYSLLFQQCDKENEGLVDIKVLLEYIQKLQLDVLQREGEEVFESHDSVSVPN